MLFLLKPPRALPTCLQMMSAFFCCMGCLSLHEVIDAHLNVLGVDFYLSGTRTSRSPGSQSRMSQMIARVSNFIDPVFILAIFQSCVSLMPDSCASQYLERLRF